MTKTTDTTVCEVDAERGLIRGYIAIWDRPDADGQVVIRGKTFKKTLLEHQPESIPYLLNNSRDSQLGTFTRIWEDEIGLAYEARLLRRRLGVYTKNSQSIINSASAGYTFYHAINLEVISERIAADDWEENEITEARLYSASLLYLPIDFPEPVYDKCYRPITDFYVYLVELKREICSSRLDPDQLAMAKLFVSRLGQLLEEYRPKQKMLAR